MKNKSSKLAKVFKALSDESRLKILLLISKNEYRCECKEEKCVDSSCMKDIAESIHLSLPTISHHIKELVNAGLITTTKNGKFVYCNINKRSIDWINKEFNKLSKNI